MVCVIFFGLFIMIWYFDCVFGFSVVLIKVFMVLKYFLLLVGFVRMKGKGCCVLCLFIKMLSR